MREHTNARLGDTRMHVAVVGAGILGLAVATQLARQGARVTIIDGGAPMSATSATSFAWVNSNGKEPRGYHDLNVAGLRGHVAWQSTLPEAYRWFHQSGSFEWTDNAADLAELRQRVETLTAIGYSADLVDTKLIKRANPGLNLLDGEAAWFKDEGYVDVSRFAAWALLELRKTGADFQFGNALVEFDDHPDKVILRLENGERITVDRVVLAAGRWTKPLLRKLGYAFDAPDPLDPTTHVRSILAYTTPLPVQVSTLLFSPELNIRPDGGGRLVLQSLELDNFLASESDLSPNGALARAYLARLASIVPFIPKDAIHELRIGRRSMTGDGLPAVGWLRDKVYLLVTHSGVTLAPALAEFAGEEILLDKTVGSLAPFRPSRLISSRDGQHLTARALPSSQ